uniref:Dystrotelin n=2 Tax=Esox lucius TaxID=8010 RepID=A0AAY5L6M2_ESOLU
MVSRSGLRVLLQDLSQVPAVVQESHVFGSAETAVRSCFSGVLSASVREEHVLSWLQCEPCLLLWLSTLYRLSVSESVTHSVRCHACKTYPITGLRYRCMKCVNIHLCQTCFLTERHTKKHKSSHPVLEHCSQPSWRESLASLAYSVRHTLLPRRYTQRKAERRGLIKAETQEEPHTSVITSDPLHQSEVSPAPGDIPPMDIAPSISPPQPLDTPLAVIMRKTSKALQTESEPQRRDSVLVNDIRDLQRDKWLLERQLQVWRVAVQSEQGNLEDRCCEMEAKMETLRKHNLRLQDMLSKATGMSGTHTDVVPPDPVTSGKIKAERDTASPLSYVSSESFSGSRKEERKEKEEESGDEDCRENEESYPEKMHRVELKRAEQRVVVDDEDEIVTGSAKETHTATMHWRETFNLHTCDGEKRMLDGQVTGPIEDQPVSEEKNSGVCSLVEEEKLCELVQQLKSKLLLDIHTHTDCRQEPGLLEAAEEVGDSVRCLVAAVKSHAYPYSNTLHTHSVSNSCYKHTTHTL